jgi:hypothetical protein
MTTADTIFHLARKASNEGIALEEARLCTVCWTVHVADECPECSARQWLYLAPLLKGFELVDARCGCKTESARAEAC